MADQRGAALGSSEHYVRWQGSLALPECWKCPDDEEMVPGLYAFDPGPDAPVADESKAHNFGYDDLAPFDAFAQETMEISDLSTLRINFQLRNSSRSPERTQRSNAPSPDAWVHPRGRDANADDAIAKLNSILNDGRDLESMFNDSEDTYEFQEPQPDAVTDLRAAGTSQDDFVLSESCHIGANLYQQRVRSRPQSRQPSYAGSYDGYRFAQGHTRQPSKVSTDADSEFELVDLPTPAYQSGQQTDDGQDAMMLPSIAAGAQHETCSTHLKGDLVPSAVFPVPISAGVSTHHSTSKTIAHDGMVDSPAHHRQVKCWSSARATCLAFLGCTAAIGVYFSLPQEVPHHDCDDREQGFSI